MTFVRDWNSKLKSAIAIVAFEFICCSSHAGLAHPGTWVNVSDDKRYVFVMLSPLPIEEDIRMPEERIAIETIRKKYKFSGMYRNDGSTDPLWIYNGEWRSRSVIIAPDGDHLIFPGDWTWDEFGINAVEFTYRGMTLHKYGDIDVIPHYRLKHALNGFYPVECEESRFNPGAMQYSLRTNQGEEFIFDVTTGKLIATRSPFPAFYAIALALLSTFVAIIVVAWRRGKAHRSDKGW